MRQTITSILDIDLSRFLTSYLIWKNFCMTKEGVRASYLWNYREGGYKINNKKWAEIGEEVHEVQKNLRLSLEEIDYLTELPYSMNIAYLTALSGGSIKDPKPIFEGVNIGFVNNKVNGIDMKAITFSGHWYQVALARSMVSTIIYNRAYDTAKMAGEKDFLYAGITNLLPKIKLVRQLNDERFKFFDCGTSVRFSKIWHKIMLDQISKAAPRNFIGTTNVALSKELNLRLIGYMEYDWQMGFQSISTYSYSLAHSTRVWRTSSLMSPRIIQASTINTDAFLKTFNKNIAARYDGVICTAGNPYDFCEKMRRHYASLGVDPLKKMVVIALPNMEMGTAINIFSNFKDRLSMSFGFDTALTNDVGVAPVNLQSEITRCYNFPVSRITEDKGQIISTDPTQLKGLQSAFKKQETVCVGG